MKKTFRIVNLDTVCHFARKIFLWQVFATFAIALYRKRWEIETLFSCLKTRGFRMEDTHMISPERIEKLLFVLAIGFCWSYKLGLAKDAETPPRLNLMEDSQKSFPI